MYLLITYVITYYGLDQSNLLRGGRHHEDLQVCCVWISAKGLTPIVYLRFGIWQTNYFNTDLKKRKI